MKSIQLFKNFTNLLTEVFPPCFSLWIYKKEKSAQML